MNKVVELKTDRLILRQWKEQDFPVFANMNADPAVMEYFPSMMNESESNMMAHRLQALIAEKSWGFWGVEIIDEQKFIGFVGLHQPTYKLPVTPCIEIGWRIAKEFWGKGYATEAARRSLKFAFEELDLNEVYSFAAMLNKKSWQVMQRLGMKNMAANFKHPIIPEAHPLSEHVLYKITQEQWEAVNCGI